MNFRISMITPVHIGNGERYTSAEFVVRGDKIFRIDTNKIFTLLNEKNQEKFIQGLEVPHFQIENFIKGIPLSEIKIYSARLKGGIPTEIHEQIKTGRRAYIPGSSIKGAIRTAILYNQITERNIEKLSRIFDMKYWQREREIQRFVDGFLSGVGIPSYSSLLKFLQVADSEPTSNLCVYTVKPLEGERSGWRWFKRGGNEVVTHHEMISAGEELEYEFRINYDTTVYRDLKLGEKEKYTDMERIKSCIHEFSHDLIEHEIEFAEKYHIAFLSEFYAELRDKNEEDAPVMKLGLGSGFMATTIGLKLKKRPETLEKVKMSLRGKTYPYEFPKTRKIIVEEKSPLGWVKLKIGN
jgi:CRISPR type III-A-associated RAMP protein Csm5